MAEVDVRSLTELHAITTLLADTVAAERALDAELEALLAQRVALADTLGGLDAATEVLEVVTADAEHVAASVAGTCALAERVSGKVRELDRAQSRVAATVVRIDAICERAGCLEGARTALSHDDFERAAAAVARYAQLDSKYPGLAPSPAEGGQAAEQHAALLATKAKLEAVVRARFTAAASERAHADVLRFAALFPLLGASTEGASLLIAYLRAAVASRARADAEALQDALHAPAGAPLVAGAESPTFASALSNLFKDIAAALEEHEALFVDSFGAEAFLRCCSELHAECDARGAQLLRRFSDHHALPRLAAACARRGSGGGANATSAEALPDPRTVEAHLEESLLLCARAEEYSLFLLAKLRAAGAPPAAAATFRGGAFSRGVVELVGHYISLEEYYMAENVAKAIRISEVEAGGLTSSMVDDVFYLLLKCGRRAGATASAQCCCAVLNHVANLLSNEFRDALAAKLRGAPQRLLAAALGGGSNGGAPTPATAANAASAAAAALNDADVSAEYVAKLRNQLEEHSGALFEGAGERERIRSCLADLGDTAAAFRAAAAAAADELAAGVAPRLRPLCDAAGSARYELSESEYGAASADAEEPWALRLLAGCEATLAPLQPLLSAGLFDALVQAVVDAVAARLEAVLWQRRFNALGALALDRDLRTLIGGLSGLTPRTVRDKFARLSQMASCVGLEAPEEILDYWGDNAGALTWRLTPAEVRRALALRGDFRAEAIAMLRL